MTDEQNPPSDSEIEGQTGASPADDASFDEFESGQSAGEKFKDLIDNNPMIKFGLIGAVLLTVIGGMMLFGGKKNNTPFSLAPQLANVKEAPGTAPVSDTYKKAVQEKNQQRVEEAIKTGKSAIPVPLATPQGKLPLNDAGQSTEDPLERWRRIQDERARREQEQKTGLPQQDPNAQAVKDMAQAMSAQMQSILATIKPTAMHEKQVTTEQFIDDKLKKKAENELNALKASMGLSSSGSGAGGDSANGSGSTAAAPVEIIVPAGTITYGQLITEANSDFKQPVLGVIVGGPLSGDRIIGEFNHDKEKDYLTLTFKTVVIDGISHGINALAIDPTTDTSGLATDVSHHYFQRVIVPGAVAFIQGVAQGISKAGTSVSQTTSSTVVTDPELTPKQYMWKGIGDSTQRIGDEIDKQNKDTDTTVVVAAGTPFGLLFIDPVTDQATTPTATTTAGR